MQPATKTMRRPLSHRLRMHEDLRTRMVQLFRDRGARPVRTLPDVLLARGSRRREGGA